MVLKKINKIIFLRSSESTKMIFNSCRVYAKEKAWKMPKVYRVDVNYQITATWLILTTSATAYNIVLI